MNLTPDKRKIIDICTKLHEEKPNATLKELAKAVSDSGLINSKTRKPYTLSTMYYTMSRLPEMQRFRTDKTKIRNPLIINMPQFPILSKWLVDNVMGEVIDQDKVTVDYAKGREIYGVCSIPAMMAASKVWWLFEGKVPVAWDIPSNGYRFRYLKFEVVY